MKYYLICKKVLGEAQFDELISALTEQIVVKFTGNIFLDKYMEILEYNMRLITLIAIGNVLKMDENEKKKKIALEETSDFLVADTLEEFENKNKFFINKITNLLK